MFFVLLQEVRQLDTTKSQTTVSSSSAEDVGYGLDFEPRETKEKWLMRIVYLGTILLVAVILWGYVKTR